MHFPEPGQIFSQRYRVEALLGSGGFSRVYRATQLDVGRDVALKILRPPIDHGTLDQQRERLENMASRFHREARMLSQLRNATTITMFDYGQTPEGLLYMVLEYIDGESLAELIEREGAVAPARVVTILEQTLEGLYEAHALGMLHRDIKPANIMIYEHLGRVDQVKLLDFGIVKKLDDDTTSSDLTDDSTLIGTPRYMSPEYILGEEVGPNSDLYSVGLVAYELATGTRAIKVDSSIQIISQHLQPTSFELPSEVPIPQGLRDIIHAMMRKDPTERYQSAEDILRDLRAISGSISPSPALGQAPTRAPLTLSAPTPSRDTTRVGGAPRAALAVGVLVVLVACIAGAVAISKTMRDGAQARPTAPTTLATTAAATTATATTSTPSSSAPEATPARPAFSITTQPAGARLTINGDDFGVTPRTLGATETITFPARVTVSLSGVTKSLTLSKPASAAVDLSVSERSDVASKAGVTTPPKPQLKPVGRRRSSRRRTTRGRKPTTKPATTPAPTLKPVVTPKPASTNSATPSSATAYPDVF